MGANRVFRKSVFHLHQQTDFCINKSSNNGGQGRRGGGRHNQLNGSNQNGGGGTSTSAIQLSIGISSSHCSNIVNSSSLLLLPILHLTVKRGSSLAIAVCQLCFFTPGHPTPQCPQFFNLTQSSQYIECSCNCPSGRG